MLDLLLTLTPISLIDSLSMLPFAVVVLAVVLGGPRPYLTAAGFLVGVFLSYLASGVLIAVGLGGIIDRVTASLAHWFKHPSPIDYVLSMTARTTTANGSMDKLSIRLMGVSAARRSSMAVRSQDGLKSAMAIGKCRTKPVLARPSHNRRTSNDWLQES